MRFLGFSLSIFDNLSALKQAYFSLAIGRGLMPSNTSSAFNGQYLIAAVTPFVH